jgi:leucyl/phenylalanyl-tRNA--protein transferase
MIYYIEDELSFPPVDMANEDGLLCFGGDLKPERLILAYSSGIFPWADNPVLWFSPENRMIIDLDNWRPSKSLKRILKKKDFEITVDTDFIEVVKACADTRDTTWISEEFIENYTELHKQGLAHSFEVRQDGELVGGLYGLSLGNAFFGESMFHRASNASKVAFSHLIQFMRYYKMDLLDCQINNPHLVSLGGIDISREEYIKQLDESLKNENKKGNWKNLLQEYLEQSNF